MVRSPIIYTTLINNNLYSYQNVIQEYYSSLAVGEHLHLESKSSDSRCSHLTNNLPEGLAKAMKAYATCKGGFGSTRKRRDYQTPTQKLIKV